MGVSLSCPFAKCNNVEDGLDSIIVKSINFAYDEIKTSPVRSASFKNEDDLEPTILKSKGSKEKMTIEAPRLSFKRKHMENTTSTETLVFDKEMDESKGSTEKMTIEAPRLSFKRKHMENTTSTETLVFDKEMDDDQSLGSKCQVEKIQSALVVPNNPEHVAALKLQKVYKSFRTRRKLADCAVLIEQSWWKLLDFAELKRSSISFFDIEKHETAISRWSRARTRAAKVGKGLSKDVKAQKLALMHWLEAIDPRHRYGHNLHFYYDKWLKSQSREPFFYWLDIGEGKEISLEKCPRAKLQQQCVKYLGPMERLPYEVVVEDGRFLYKQSGELLDTTGEGSHGKWIFVLSTSKTLYVGKKKKGSFQHSSFLAGGATSCAGILVVEYGVLKAVWPHSGHYRPTEENFKEFISFLQENNVDLSNVKMTSVDEGDDLRRGHPRIHSSEEDLTGNMSGLEEEEETSVVESSIAPKTSQFQNFGRELTKLEIPKRGQVLGGLDNEKGGGAEQNKEFFQMDSPTSGQDFYDEKHVGTIPKVSKFKRVISDKERKSYQLGKQLSCKWTTGAGPRIGCVRNHPCELQFRVLEQVNLSPRSGCRSLRTTISDTNYYYSHVMSE